MATTLCSCAGDNRQEPSAAAQNLTWVPADELRFPERTATVHHAAFATSVPIQEFVRFGVTKRPPKCADSLFYAVGLR